MVEAQKLFAVLHACTGRVGETLRQLRYGDNDVFGGLSHGFMALNHSLANEFVALSTEVGGLVVITHAIFALPI